MVVSAERERMRQDKAQKEVEKQKIRALKEATRAERELKRQREVAEKELKRKEREALEAERELKKREKEARKQQEEAKKQQTEAEKEQRRKEKEAAEAEKENKRKERELKRQQDEAEKELKRKEKEAAERKKQVLLQKQANVMARLFRKKEVDAILPEGGHCSADNAALPSRDQETLESDSSSRQEPSTADVMLRVDEGLRSTCIKNGDELLQNHVVSWQEKWKCRSSEPFRRWGIRTKPKTTVFGELRLQGAGTSSSHKTDSLANVASCSNSAAPSSSLKRKRQEDESFDDCKLEDGIVLLDDDTDVISSPPMKKICSSRWKLLQFDKSHRPAYYGTFSKVSSTIRPRRPFKQEPSLNYEVDSDEEWEEEDPGESLSDCEDKEEDMDKGELEVDEDAADGFVVPDGYLSEEEGLHLEEADFKDAENTLKSQFPGESSTSLQSLGSMDEMGERRQQLLKVLDDVTNHALKRNRPFLISNLEPPGENCTNVENQTERLCFESLRMVVANPNVFITPPTVQFIGEISTSQAGSTPGKNASQKATADRPQMAEKQQLLAAEVAH